MMRIVELFAKAATEELSAKGAIFNEDRSRRYILWRRVKENDDLPWNEGKDAVLFIGLNPSIADEEILDPTVKSFYNYARDGGFHYLLMGNLYSEVSTDPTKVDFNIYSRESDNWNHLADAVGIADIVLVGWGTNASPQAAALWLYRQTRTPYCLGKNQNGSPKHPLYLRADIQPEVFLASADGRFTSGAWE